MRIAFVRYTNIFEIRFESFTLLCASKRMHNEQFRFYLSLNSVNNMQSTKYKSIGNEINGFLFSKSDVSQHFLLLTKRSKEQKNCNINLISNIYQRKCSLYCMVLVLKRLKSSYVTFSSKKAQVYLKNMHAFISCPESRRFFEKNDIKIWSFTKILIFYHMIRDKRNMNYSGS